MKSGSELPQCNLCILTYYFCFSHRGHLLPNLALNKTAVQSSNGDNIGFAFKAIDGNRDENYQGGSCTLTLSQSDPWWRVDLARVYTVGAVVITNGAGFENRLDGAEIWIGKSTNFSDPECAVISHIPSGQTFYFPCSSIEGRYVTVFLPGSEKVLNLCEVEVYYGNHIFILMLIQKSGSSQTPWTCWLWLFKSLLLFHLHEFESNTKKKFKQ
uniref:Fucolectin tachylectin-4 pentraxin-1 domain-containing protein n=1 Tax=Oreochromis aureus TaxID=47969 RepID=A0AAZ1Y4W9_OREAU